MTLKKIAIVGLGLMGGSLAARCRRQFPKSRIIGISRSSKAIKTAVRKRWIHSGTSDLYDGAKDADLVVLCTPVDLHVKTLKILDCLAKPGACVTDVGSVKKEIFDQLKGYRWKRIKFISAHPMVGSHERGIEAVNPHLYDNGYSFVIYNGRKTTASYKAVKRFWKKICPRIVEVTPSAHDEIVSEISHLPHLLAVCLMQMVDQKKMSLAGSGFKSMTRLAMGDASIWFPILQANRRTVRKSLKNLEKQVRQCQKMLSDVNGSALKKSLSKAAKKRLQI